jgi:sorbitol-specific phosphotransferase system component IIBC
MVIVGVGALWSAFLNIRDHQAYASASRFALFGAALFAFVNPTGIERLITNRPLVAVTIGILLVVMICGYYLVFFVVFPPPK